MIDTLIEHLKSQNNTLDSVNTNIKSMNSSLATMILSDRKDELRRREAADDAKRAASAASRTTSTAGGGKKGGGSRFGGIGGALGGFGAGALASKGVGLLGRGAFAAGLNLGADSIASYVQEQTGSSDLGDAAHRAAKLGSFGILLGKRFAVLGAVGGALATPENIAELEKLGDKAEGLKEPLMKFVGALPSLSSVVGKLTETVNGTLKLINSVIEGDVPAALDNLDEAAVLALGVKGGMDGKKNRRQIAQASREALQRARNKAKNIAKPVSQMEFSKQQRQQFNSETAKGLSEKKVADLAKDGLKVDTKTGAISKVGGGFVSADEVDEKFAKNKIKTSTKSLGAKNFIDEINGKAAAKFGKFGKALSYLKKVPVVGSLIGGGIIANILMDDTTSKKEKAALLSKELGSIGGAALGGALFGMIGTVVPGVGTLALGIGGAIAGAVSGEELGERFANWMLGEDDSTAKPAAAASAGAGGNKRRRGAGAKPSPASSSVAQAPYPQSGVKVATASSDMFAAQAQQNIMVVDNSNVSNNVSTQAGDVSFSGTTGFDFYDPMMGSRTA